MLSPVHERVFDVSTEPVHKEELEFLEEAFLKLDIYSQCSSFNPTDIMAEKDKPFFKDGINELFTEAVSTQDKFLFMFNLFKSLASVQRNRTVNKRCILFSQTTHVFNLLNNFCIHFSVQQGGLC